MGTPALAHHLPTEIAVSLPADLAEVVEAWPGLPEATRAAILAMVRGDRPRA